MRPYVKITPAMSIQIHEMDRAGMTQIAIGKELGIANSTVSRHIRGIKQHTIPSAARGPIKPQHQLSNVLADDKLADCAICGPAVRVYYRPSRGRWICQTTKRGSRNGFRVKLGVDLQKYNEMLADQSGVCALCFGLNPSGRSLAVDHCHETGRVRGLLCSLCNTALGLMKDDPERLLRAVDYLRVAG